MMFLVIGYKKKKRINNYSKDFGLSDKKYVDFIETEQSL